MQKISKYKDFKGKLMRIGIKNHPRIGMILRLWRRKKKKFKGN